MSEPRMKDMTAMIESEQINSLVNKMFGVNVQVSEWMCEPIDCESINFTTSGIYRVAGMAEVENQSLPWSIILKIIQRDSTEKDRLTHHNYWKREAFVFQSNILEGIPEIKSPKCYLVKDQMDGTVWLWMEEIKEDNNQQWSEKEFSFIARQLGKFNGAYLTGRQLPNETWICPRWLRSWVNGSRQYAGNPLDNYSLITNENSNIDAIWCKYINFKKNIDSYIDYLMDLPRVLAHQDLSQKNIYVGKDSNGNEQLTLIDWQFMSISAIGEDLGKLYGQCMSGERIPQSLYRPFKELLFENYLDGLRETGWTGDSELARYGYCVSFAARSEWEVPLLMKAVVGLASDVTDKTLSNKIKKYEQITSLQMDAAEEVEILKKRYHF